MHEITEKCPGRYYLRFYGEKKLLSLDKREENKERLFGGSENIRRLVGNAKNDAGSWAEMGQADDAGSVKPEA